MLPIPIGTGTFILVGTDGAITTVLSNPMGTDVQYIGRVSER